jgi:hypothetical protein
LEIENYINNIEEKIANSVPFEVVKKECENMCNFNGDKMICHKEDIYCTTADKCSLIPKKGG